MKVLLKRIAKGREGLVMGLRPGASKFTIFFSLGHIRYLRYTVNLSFDAHDILGPEMIALHARKKLPREQKAV